MGIGTSIPYYMRAISDIENLEFAERKLPDWPDTASFESLPGTTLAIISLSHATNVIRNLR